MSVWSIVAIVGGILAFIALFLAWVKVSIDLGIIGSDSANATGLDLLGNKLHGEKVEYSFVKVFPLIIAILGILCIITSVLPTFIDKNKEMAIATTVLAVIALILCIIFLCTGLKSSLFTGDYKTEIELIGSAVKYSAQAGLIIALVGSILGVIGGALNIKDSL